MDAVVGLLEGPRAREAFLLRCTMSAPWAVEVRDRAPLTLLTAVRGAAVLAAGSERHRLAPGDVAVVRGPAPYSVADADGTPAEASSSPSSSQPAVRAVVHPGQRCTAPDGGPQHAMGEVGVRAWGNSPEPVAQDVLLVGTYTQVRAVSEELLGALPAVVVVAGGEWSCPYLPLLAEEAAHEAPGQQAVLDRLLDLVLVAVLRHWFERSPGRGAGQGWWSGDDPVVAGALRHLHEQPERDWGLPALARAVGVSRATLARRFTAAVGEPPMAHLTRWRLALAADLLAETDAPLDAVARRVGYGSGAALSAAFTRERGAAPSRHRAHHRGSRTGAAGVRVPVASSTGWQD